MIEIFTEDKKIFLQAKSSYWDGIRKLEILVQVHTHTCYLIQKLLDSNEISEKIWHLYIIIYICESVFLWVLIHASLMILQV